MIYSGGSSTRGSVDSVPVQNSAIISVIFPRVFQAKAVKLTWLLDVMLEP